MPAKTDKPPLPAAGLNIIDTGLDLRALWKDLVEVKQEPVFTGADRAKYVKITPTLLLRNWQGKLNIRRKLHR